MAAGLKVYNEDGTLRDKIDSRFPQVLKILQIPTSAKGVKGYIEVPELANIPQGFKIFHFISMGDAAGLEWPEITITGTTLKYSYEFYQDSNIQFQYGDNALGSEDRINNYILLVLGICPYV